MRTLITGANGQLGTELSKIMPNALLTDYKDLDITDFDAVRDFVRENKVGNIINCAAYTAVDDAENNYLAARQINAVGPQNLARTGCKLVHISTDYVFDGDTNIPYRPNDTTHPKSIYGWTKRMGELAVMKNAEQYVILRTAWLYSPYGKNFVKTMRHLGAEKESIGVVSDQFGTPTYAADLANAITKIIPQIHKNNSGIYHYTNMGQCSWYDFACEIMNISGLNCKVNPISTEQYPTRAIRPKYSVLDKTKTMSVFEVSIPQWRDALKRCIKEMENQRIKG